jgi:hypothetical protein
MKIQKVLHSCDDKKFYSDFWPIVSKIWKTKFNIEPVLLYFGDSEKDGISKEYGQVVDMEILEGIPLNTQAQVSRYWYPVNEPDTVWLTSDIDMIPISRYYFIDMINDAPDNSWVHLNGDPKESYPNIHFLCCYNAAKGSTFIEFLDLKPTWKEFMNSINWEQNTHTYAPSGLQEYEPEKFGEGMKHWGIDEMWSSSKLNKQDSNRIIRYFRECGPHNCRRIDRLDWNWDNDKIINEYYYDCHSQRPYEFYKESIDLIQKNILNGF